jgi:excisionase family DNA binding protein
MKAVAVKNSEILNKTEAAMYMGLRPQTLDNWRSTGRYRLPFIRIGTRTIRYRREDLDQFLSSRMVNQVEATV